VSGTEPNTVGVESSAPGDGIAEPARAKHETPEEDLTGTYLLHFRVVARLGAGGMGVVYKAIDEKLRRPVALKVLGARYVADANNRELIFREARSAAAVHHPNIATIYDVNEAPHAAFLAMELVDGETLRAKIERGALDAKDALAIAAPIAEGLAFAHKHGVVHRDLKPDNVMLTSDGRVKILDFGLAKASHEAEPLLVGRYSSAEAASPAALAPTVPVSSDGTRAGSVMGTPAYMAPEQARGETVDARADVFAFGVVLYEMLAGARPFARASKSPSEWGGAGSPDWTAAPLARGVAPAVRALVDRCLAFDPNERFATGAELHAALRSAMHARGAGRTVAIAGAAVAIAAASSAALWLATRSRESVPTEPVAASASASATPPTAPIVLRESLVLRMPETEICEFDWNGGSVLCLASDLSARLIDAATGESTEIGAPAALHDHLLDNFTAHPDGRWVVMTQKSGSSSTWIIDRKAEATLLVDGVRLGVPDATGSRYLGFNDHAYVIRRLDGQSVTIPRAIDASIISLAWSPRGDAFAVLEESRAGVQAWVDVVRVGDYGRARVTDNPRIVPRDGVASVQWPEMDRIAYVRHRQPPGPQSSEVVDQTIDASGAPIGEPRVIYAANGELVSSFAVLRDRAAVITMRRRPTIITGRLNAGGTRFIEPATSEATSPVDVYPIGFRPDGTLVAYAADTTTGEGRIEARRSGAPPELIANAPAASLTTISPTLAPNGDVIYWDVGEGDAGACRLVRRDDRGNERVVTPASPGAGGIPCSSRIFCPRSGKPRCALYMNQEADRVLRSLDLDSPPAGRVLHVFPNATYLMGISANGADAFIAGRECTRVDLSTGKPRTMPGGAAGSTLQSIASTPDGAAVVVTALGPSAYSIVRIDAAGERTVLLSSKSSWYWSPTIDATGRFAAYAREYDARIHIFDIVR
jgi:serine/threonine protein kinase